jgi:hypothetical protein
LKQRQPFFLDYSVAHFPAGESDVATAIRSNQIEQYGGSRMTSAETSIVIFVADIGPQPPSFGQ